MSEHRIIVVTEPAIEPVTLAELKLWVRVDAGAEDDLLNSAIKDAREEAESLTGRSFITTSLELWIKKWPGKLFSLPRANLLDVTSVKYFDDTETQQTLATSVYDVHAPAGARAQKGEISLKPDQEWPCLGCTEWPIRIEYTSGYGATVDTVPEGIKTAIKAKAAFLYANREPEVMGGAPVKMETFTRQLEPYKVY